MFQESSRQLNVSPEEYQLLLRLRERNLSQNPFRPRPATGERIADQVAATVGSWRFIITQTIILVLWILFNVINGFRHWDPYPFILLNLALSFQAAYIAPIIMMSQNRQADIDRAEMHLDCEVNIKSDLELELLQDKMNLIREDQIPEILERLQRIEALLTQK